MEEKKAGNVVDLREIILEFIRRNGPILPVKLAKEIGKDITFTGAVLSELAANKKILISNTKIGGSPVYYMTGQEPRLQMLEKNLNGKEKDAFRLLREKKLIKDIGAEPWQRVALRSIKDFAVPINVITQDGRNELFWKWYMTNDQEIKKLVEGHLAPVKDIRQEQQEQIIEVKNADIKKQEIMLQKQEVLQSYIEREEKPLEQPFKKTLAEKISAKSSLEKTSEKSEERPKEIVKKQRIERDVELPVDMGNYLEKKKIEILAKEINKRGKEVDLVAYVPSELGRIKFFIAYRSKRKINEADISMVFSKAQIKNLPAILLGNGELTKKAREYLERDFRSVTFHKI